LGRPFGRLYIRSLPWRELPETSAEPRFSRSSGSGCTSGRPRATSRSRRFRGARSRSGAASERCSSDGTAEREAQSAAEQARARAANRERIIKLQQPRTGEFAGLKPAAGATAAEEAAARTQLVRSVETAITADAVKRGATGEISKVRGPTTCTPAAGGPASGPVGVFDCYTVVRKVPKVETNAAGSIGYPFRAVVNYSTFSYAFCRTEQFPGEQLIPDPRTVVQLPAACRAG
jgi:hypothetical protein